ncbi:MAG: type II secretion system protein N [Candidatus Omnitrophota bacterium]
MNKNASPEQRLLDLIKGKSKKGDPRHPESGAAQDSGAPPGPAKKNRAQVYMTEIFKTDIFKNKMFDPDRLKTLNKYLVIAASLLAVYFFIELIFIRPYKDLETVISAAARVPSKPPKAEKDITSEQKDYSYYSGDISRKKIFTASSGDATAPKIGVSSDALNDLGLVGIIPGDDPQAIIEDKKNQKTYYLNKGQSFDNFTVEEITESKVVLDQDGRKIALFL